MNLITSWIRLTEALHDPGGCSSFSVTPAILNTQCVSVLDDILQSSHSAVGGGWERESVCKCCATITALLQPVLWGWADEHEGVFV